jgi:hypothetical protein
MTMPQVIMLNHGSWVNSKRMDSKSGSETPAATGPGDPVVWHGKKLSQLTTDEMQQYYSEWS